MSQALLNVRVGLAGTGAMAEYHARRFSSLPGVRVSACADRQGASAEAFARRMSIPRWHQSYAALCDPAEVDCVAVSVVDAAHMQVIQVALEQGLPVFAEKPLARTVKEARALCAAAGRAAVPAAVNFSKRNAPAVALARRLIREGALGRVTSARFSYLQSWLLQDEWGRWDQTPRWRWRLCPDICTEGAIGDLGSHIFDTAAHLLGPAVTVFCAATALTPDPRDGRAPRAPDGFSAVLGLAAGTLLEAAASWRAPGHLDDFAFEVRGEKGALCVDLGSSRDEVRLFDLPARAWSAMQAPPVPSTYELFIQAVRHGAPAEELPGFEHGLAAQAVIEACAASTQGGGTVRV